MSEAEMAARTSSKNPTSAVDRPITASMLYNVVTCPHRVTMDVRADPNLRDAPNPFVELLWERGSDYEREVIAASKDVVLDLTSIPNEQRETKTYEAIAKGTPLIYGARIRADDLLGEPDLLRQEAGGYVAGDIKSGSAEEGREDKAKPKAHYAVQLGLYTDILERRGVSAGRRGFVWDIDGREVEYNYSAAYGKRNPRTLWDDYQVALADTRAILDGAHTRPAASAACKLCHWYSACRQEIRALDDLTMIPELGRAKRDTMLPQIQTVAQLAHIDIGVLVEGEKTVFSGIGAATLQKYQTRARLLTTPGAQPFTRAPIEFPPENVELFFDVEVDPMREICYLHGFLERRNGDNSAEQFMPIFAQDATADAERQAFAEAWSFIRSRQQCTIFSYSKYERTTYRVLQAKYPDVCSAEDVETLFGSPSLFDLYDIVKKSTEWPTWDFSIKTLANFLGFEWRDPHPSGAASIEWFHRWIEVHDNKIRQRILDYNEDDCRAMRVLRDALVQLSVLSEAIV